MSLMDEDAVLAKRDPRIARNMRREARRAAASASNDDGGDAEKERLAKVMYDTTEHKLTIDELEAVMRNKPRRDYEKNTPQTEYGTGMPNYSFQKEMKGDMDGRVVIPWEQRKLLTHGFDELHLNQLSQAGDEHWIVAFIKELTGFFALLLWGGSLLCFIGFGLRQDYDNLYLGIVLAVVVIVTGVFSFSQNAQSANLMAQFSKLMANNVRVATDRAPHTVTEMNEDTSITSQTDGTGKHNTQEEKQFDSRFLVRGDVIKLSTGDKVPADIRIIYANDFKVNNSPLTGEPDELTRKAEDEKRDDAKESINMIFFGTDVTEGEAVGVVMYTGDDTFIGKIAVLTQQTDDKQTPINREIHHFIGIVSAVAIFLGVSFFIIGAALGTDIISNLVFMIGIIVANVPEGLLATVTVSLALTSQAMAEKQVLVKNMEGVETLGSTTAICSDKTGTLTQNRMTIAEIIMNNELFSSPFVQEASSSVQEFDPSDPTWPFFREALTMNTAAVFSSDSLKKISGLNVAKVPFFTKASDAAVPQIMWEVVGDASETAMIKMALYTHADLYKPVMPTEVGEICTLFNEDRITKDRSTRSAKVAEIPFKSKNKYHVVVTQNTRPDTEEGGAAASADEAAPYTVYMKGAQEKIVERCSHMYKDGAIVEITDAMRKKLRVTVNGLMAKGRRLLGFAKYDMTRQDCEDAGADYEFAAVGANGQAIAKGNAAATVANEAGKGSGGDKAVEAKPGMFSATMRNFPMGEKVVDESLERPSAPTDDQSEQEQEKYQMQLKQYEGHQKLTTKKLVFIGITALIDPPRPAVPDAVLQCQSAGIRVVMVTGDHPKTAAAIARMVNIFSSNTFRIGDMKQTLERKEDDGTVTTESYDPCVVQPNDHDQLVEVGETRAIAVPGWSFTADTPDAKWDYIFDHDEIVFARTSPDQKLQIVERFQNDENEVVAVTGDGVNDAPALKTANIGVAMGIAGTEVTKGAADMILTDDNFASIVRGVESGRLIFDNLKKSIAYTLSSNIPEITPFLIFITVQTPLPLSTVLILCIDLGTDMVPAISMAWENKEADIMRRPARDSDVDRLVTRKLISFAYLQIGVIQATAGFFTWVVVLNDYGYPPEILPGLGAFDNWGKQMLFCRVAGGRMRDTAGATFEGSQDNMAAIEAGFPLWDAGLTGFLEECTYPVRNLRIDRDPPSGWDIEDASTYGDATADQFVISRQSIQSLVDAGYIPFIPYKAFVSPFWNDSWLAWDQREGFQGDVPGSGDDPTPIIFFGSQLPGWFNLDENSTPFGNTARGSSEALDILRASLGSENQYGFATFVQPEANTCDLITGVCRTDDGSITVNVASRMCQKEALHHAQCAFFVSIVVVQWADLLICKTRWLSIYDQGMVNPAMNFGIIFETLLAALLCYVPGIGNGLGTRPLRALHWVPAVPFSLVIFLYDEIRKYLMRATTEQQVRNKQVVQVYGWLARNTYY